MTDNWSGEVVEDLEPYEKWDLIAWPKRGIIEDDFTQFFELMDTPHINGEPMQIGYVKAVGNYVVEVIKAEPSAFGPPRMELHNREFTKIIQKNDIVAKKQREHNEKYQKEKEKRQKRRRRAFAKMEWRKLSLLKRIWLTLTGSKESWLNHKRSRWDDE